MVQYQFDTGIDNLYISSRYVLYFYTDYQNKMMIVYVLDYSSAVFMNNPGG